MGVRVGVYISDALKARLDAAPRINASAVFQRALEEALGDPAKAPLRPGVSAICPCPRCSPEAPR